MKQLIFLALIFQISYAHSQTNNGKVNGLISNDGRSAVAFANIMLHRVVDSSFVKASISDEKGNFEIDNLPEGNYYLKVTHASFET